MKTAIVSDPISLQHLTGRGHLESPQRFSAIIEALNRSGLKTRENSLSPRKATKEEILLCHSSNYYAVVEENIRQAQERNLLDGRATLSTGDVQFCPDSWEAAHAAAGAVLTAVDAVMKGEADNAYCIVRPPGHHATSYKGMGFCIFNNVSIGARYVQKKYGISKVLIVDWDVHHGNGTEEIFSEDPSVFYFSTHQEGIYPGTGLATDRGKGAGLGTTMNLPIAEGRESREKVLDAFRGDLAMAMEKFRPQFVFISAGFDAHELDPLGGFNLTETDFAELTWIVKDIAKRFSQARLVSVLEGGYHLQAIAACSVAHVRVLNE